MSRIGKKPIKILQGVEIKIEGQNIKVKGPKGEIEKKVRPEANFEIKDDQIFVSIKEGTKKPNAFLGLTRAIVANMVKGVSEGYEKKLQIEGLGFKAQLKGSDLDLFVGFTHPVEIKAPEGINFLVEKNIITVSGIDRELVGQIAAIVKRTKPPEPYKGKGIRYLNEKIRRKEGKKTVASQ